VAVDAKRNDYRLPSKNEKDLRIMSNYLPAKVEQIFGEPLVGPNDAFVAPGWLLKMIAEVAKTDPPVHKAPPVVFGMDTKSVEANHKSLSSFDFGMSELLDQYADTTLG